MLWAKFLISYLGLVGFLYVYCVLFWKKWDASNQPTVNFLQLTSVLTGLVSGVVATMLGVELPSNGVGGGIGNQLNAMGSFVSPINAPTPNQILAGVYLVVYLAMVIWAITIWIGPANRYRPQIIDGLAAVGLGIFAAVITGHMG